jgi:hypothetical protein
VQIAFRFLFKHTRAPSRYSAQTVFRRLQASTLIVATFSSCVSVSRADRAELNRVSFRVMEDSVSLHRSSESIAFEVNAVVRNDTRRTLLAGVYRISVQRQIDASWQTVWVGNCLDCPDYGAIVAGGSIVIPVGVYASLRPDMFSRADPRLMTGGRYRLLLELGFEKTRDSRKGDSSVHFVVIPGPPTELEFRTVRPSSVFVVADSSH